MAALKASTSNDVVRQRPKLLDSESLQPYLCVFCKSLLYEPYQSICGDRACYSCLKDLAKKIKDNGLSSTRCPGCGDQISHEQFFPDKAATRELNALSVSCPNEGCQWEGLYKEYFETHLGVCPQARIKCPYDMCTEHVIRKNLDRHIKKCGFRPERCQFCGRDCRANQIDEHYEMCDQFPIKCTEGCGEEIPRGSMKSHVIDDCLKIKRACRYSPVGCKFEGSGDDMIMHEEKYVQYHLRMIWKRLQEAMKGTKSLTPHNSNHPVSIEASLNHVDHRISELTRQLGDNMTEVQRMKTESHARAVATEDAIVKIQRSIKELQDYYSDIALNIQTIQASSHGPVYIWKIPDLSRRRREAVLGMTVSLYSAPFYTSRHGYKICLCKKSQYYHSYFWPGPACCVYCHPGVDCWHGPVRCMYCHPGVDCWHRLVCCMYCHPEFLFSPTLTEMNISNSFQRPKTEMNVASGCPMFCPLFALQNPCCVQNDRPCQHCHFGNTEVLMATPCEDCPNGDSEEFVPR